MSSPGRLSAQASDGRSSVTTSDADVSHAQHSADGAPAAPDKVAADDVAVAPLAPPSLAVGLKRASSRWGFDPLAFFGGFVVSRPATLVVVALVLLSPFLYIAWAKSKFGALPSQIVPRSTPSGAMMLELEREFGAR